MSNLLLPQHINKDIPGFEGRYYARTDGKIFSYPKEWRWGRCLVLTCHAGIELKQVKGTAYLVVTLYPEEGERKLMYSHVLIAKTFIPNPLCKPEVNHIDGDKLNNNYSNLEWNTSKENTQHAHRIGLVKYKYGKDSCGAKLTEVEVMEIINSQESGSILGKRFGISTSQVCRIKRGIRWPHFNNIDRPEKLPFVPANRKLTEEQVVEILESEKRTCDLARKYGVSESVVFKIQTGRSWKYITAPMGPIF